MSTFARQASLNLAVLTGLASFFIGAAVYGQVGPQASTSIPESTKKLNMSVLQEAGAEINNLHPVSWDLVRGAQPSDLGLKLLKDAGVKTIVNLRNEEKLVAKEGESAERLGLKYVNIPLAAFSGLPQEAIDQFLSIVQNPEYQPVFVHCMQGQDRTGALCAAYRMRVQGWKVQPAFDEAVKYGFKPYLANLTSGLWQYSGTLGNSEPKPNGYYIFQDLKNRLKNKNLMGNKH